MTALPFTVFQFAGVIFNNIMQYTNYIRIITALGNFKYQEISYYHKPLV